MSKIILTGDRPTGRLHLGHYVGSLKRRVELQNSGEYEKIFIMIADAQALTDNADNPEKVRQNIIEVALDYLSVGIDPAKSNIFIQSQISQLTELTFYYMNLVTVSRLQRNPTVKSEIQMRNFEASIPVGFFCYPISQAADITAFKATTVPVGEDQEPMIEQCPEKVRQNIIEVALDYLSVGIDPAKSNIFIQSQISQLTELTFYYMNLVTVSRLQRNPTVKSEIQMRNFEASIPVGFFCYPISQAADITAFKATTVPVGEDQEPMIEQCREIVRKFNSVYGEALVEPEILLPDNKACLRLPGTDGKAKMSKSLGNCIYLSDTPEEVKKKVMSMYTDPNHIQVSDPGQVEGNTVFTYLDAFSSDEDFAEFLPDYKNLDELKDHYRRGGLGDVKVKKFLLNVINKELEPIRARRHEYEKDIPEVYNILKKGTEAAYAVAQDTLDDVKAAMKIDYFNDAELIKVQSEKYSRTE